MKFINYEMKQNEELLPVSIGYNETNLEIAKKEAYNGEYTIEDDGEPAPEPEASADEIINALLGVE